MTKWEVFFTAILILENFNASANELTNFIPIAAFAAECRIKLSIIFNSFHTFTAPQSTLLLLLKPENFPFLRCFTITKVSAFVQQLLKKNYAFRLLCLSTET